MSPYWRTFADCAGLDTAATSGLGPSLTRNRPGRREPGAREAVHRHGLQLAARPVRASSRSSSTSWPSSSPTVAGVQADRDDLHRLGGADEVEVERGVLGVVVRPVDDHRLLALREGLLDGDAVRELGGRRHRRPPSVSVTVITSSSDRPPMSLLNDSRAVHETVTERRSKNASRPRRRPREVSQVVFSKNSTKYVPFGTPLIAPSRSSLAPARLAESSSGAQDRRFPRRARCPGRRCRGSSSRRCGCRAGLSASP